MKYPESELTTYDIHLAADHLTETLLNKLVAISFRVDRFEDGTEGVKHAHHLSLHPKSRSEFERIWTQTMALLGETSAVDFCGYGEAEIVSSKYTAAIELRPFDPSVPLPFGPVLNVECPPGKSKTFDFHVSADIDTLDTGLAKVLGMDLGLYHVDITKPRGTVRVFTFQPMDVPESPRPYFDALLRYLQNAGGMKGKIKMEATFAFKRFPEDAHVPPVVTQMPPIRQY